MELTNWIKTHNLISMSSLEKALGLSHGNLKLNKKIPDKHRSQIIKLLEQYGYDKKDSVDRPISLPTPKLEAKVEANILSTMKMAEMRTTGLCIKNAEDRYGRATIPVGTKIYY